MFEALNLSGEHIALLTLITFLAGLVRGFSGFALSALVMAAAAFFLSPVALIPMLWWLELVASLLMFKGGWRDADRRISIALVIGSAVGVPLGLYLTTSIEVETSKMIALAIIIVLAATQLAKIRLAFLATNTGLYGTGIAAGIVTGLAGVGGMIVALYVLAQDAPAKSMRGSLVVFLFLGSITSFAWHLAYGIMDQTAILRGLAFALPTAAGVVIGQKFFTPKYEPFYKPICLSLLIGLAAFGIVRIGM